jgi:hypothetical protein
MLGAKLRDLDTGINILHYLVAYAVYLVAENERIFFIIGGVNSFSMVLFSACSMAMIW